MSVQQYDLEYAKNMIGVIFEGDEIILEGYLKNGGWSVILLALCYAIAYPERVKRLVLRKNIFGNKQGLFKYHGMKCKILF